MLCVCDIPRLNTGIHVNAFGAGCGSRLCCSTRPERYLSLGPSTRQNRRGLNSEGSVFEAQLARVGHLDLFRVCFGRAIKRRRRWRIRGADQGEPLPSGEHLRLGTRLAYVNAVAGGRPGTRTARTAL
jgi:hypothetical protein